MFKNTDFVLNEYVYKLIFFNKPNLFLNCSGETCCYAIKVARNNNLKICNDSDAKKPLYGRNIDLLLNTLFMDDYFLF